MAAQGLKARVALWGVWLYLILELGSPWQQHGLSRGAAFLRGPPFLLYQWRIVTVRSSLEPDPHNSSGLKLAGLLSQLAHRKAGLRRYEAVRV